jgi:hypothetical protein
VIVDLKGEYAAVFWNFVCTFIIDWLWQYE